MIDNFREFFYSYSEVTVPDTAQESGPGFRRPFSGGAAKLPADVAQNELNPAEMRQKRTKNAYTFDRSGNILFPETGCGKDPLRNNS